MPYPQAQIDDDKLVELYRQTGSLNKAAEILGVSDRTLNRRKAADPVLARRLDEAKAAWLDARPPGATRYDRGCRCTVCRAGNAAVARAYNARLREEAARG